MKTTLLYYKHSNNLEPVTELLAELGYRPLPDRKDPEFNSVQKAYEAEGTPAYSSMHLANAIFLYNPDIQGLEKRLDELNKTLDTKVKLETGGMLHINSR